MNSRAQIRMLPDGVRLHMQDGPIDVIVQAFGEELGIEKAYCAASARFVSILDELCAELPLLRKQVSDNSTTPTGTIARNMYATVKPYAPQLFITPMAAVAGAVAQEILSAMTLAANLSRAYVNDGGDIALHLAPREQFVIGMIDRPDQPSLFGTTTISYDDPIRGIATSGWRGRSFSLGIADAVTVLADTAAMADAAATVIANAVDLPGHPAIKRIPADELDPNSDLRDIPVTQSVGELAPNEIATALASGIRVAEHLRETGLIRAAALNLQHETRVIGYDNGSQLPRFATATEVHRSPLHA
jgi:uncharacterized protein